jgi:hypothetical protein
LINSNKILPAMRRKKKRNCLGLRHRPRKRAPRGAVVLELILTFPIWLIFLLAIIEFGELYANRQQVALASRVGAEEASETPELPLNDGDPVPANVLQRINQQLASSGISYCGVILEHNLVPSDPGSVPVPVTLISGDCTCPREPTFPPDSRTYVRLTVITPMTQVTPNLLRTFGFDVSDRFVQHTTTFRYEL